MPSGNDRPPQQGTAEDIETTNERGAQRAAEIATDGVSMVCPHCRNRVIPVIVVSRNLVTVIVAAVLCLLCLWPCAICVYCLPCGVKVEHYCTVCGRLIIVETVR